MVVRRAICLALLLFLQACQSQDALEADVLITGGRVFTGEAGSTVVEMDVAVRDGKIVFVGDASELNIQAAETLSETATRALERARRK